MARAETFRDIFRAAGVYLDVTRAVFLILLLASPRAFADGTCVVRGSSVTLQEVTVQPPRDTAFQLGLIDVPVSATLPARCGAPLMLDVQGEVVFKASRDLVWLTLSRDITSPDGMVTAKRGAHIIDACVRGGVVVGSAILDADDILPGEHKDDVTVVRDLEMPCDALTLDDIQMSDTDMLGFDPAPAAATPGPHDSEVEHSWQLRDEEAMSVTLFAKPARTSHSRKLESPNCSGCIRLREILLRKDWVLVEMSSDGVTVRGWMPRRLGKREEGGIYGGSMCTGNHGGGGWGETPPASSFESEATVRIGTSVYASSTGTSPWAVFSRDARVRVRVTAGSSWAELRQVSGLDGSPQGSPWLHGVVPLSAVKLDATAKP